MPSRHIPVIDLFAGPGGLAEGFAAYRSKSSAAFDIKLSIEKDSIACETLRLRKFFRAFPSPPIEYHAYTRGEIDRESLFDLYPAESAVAKSGTWQAELGKTTQSLIYQRVRKAVGRSRRWVLLGGPPCQAYSIVGRSRMKDREDFEADVRHFLYREYLRIVANHAPAVFVMENVKGLISATHGGDRIFERIQADLREPGRAARISRRQALRYELYALAAHGARGASNDVGHDFLVRAEDFGIPQKRHRVFIIGIRSDILVRPPHLKRKARVNAAEVLCDLPKLRSRLSREIDSPMSWRDAIQELRGQRWFRAGLDGDWGDVVRVATRVLGQVTWPTNVGSALATHARRPKSHSRWYREHARGITQHETRRHMRSDLWRYFFCACFAAARGRSPNMKDFPTELRPKHKNVSQAVDDDKFGDRFRVQLADHPASTVTSHIAKDGHYFIHYDPRQCRSLTPREAARIQTFPDSYYFEGPPTSQFHQIGNAVPPLLARGIAAVVHDILVAPGGRPR